MISSLKECDKTANEKQPLAEYSELLNVGEVCEILRLSGRVVRDYLAKGKIPGVKIGSRWVIPKKKLIEYLYS